MITWKELMSPSKHFENGIARYPPNFRFLKQHGN